MVIINSCSIQKKKLVNLLYFYTSLNNSNNAKGLCSIFTLFVLCVSLLAAEKLELRADSYPARPAVAILWLLRCGAFMPGLGLWNKFDLVHGQGKVIFQKNPFRLLKESNREFVSLATIPRSSAVSSEQLHPTSEEPYLLIKNYKTVQGKSCQALLLS